MSGSYRLQSIADFNQIVSNLKDKDPETSSLYEAVADLMTKAKSVLLDGKKAIANEGAIPYSKKDLESFSMRGSFALEYDYPIPASGIPKLGLGYELPGKNGIAVPMEKRLLLLHRIKKEGIQSWLAKIMGVEEVVLPGWMDDGAIFLFQLMHHANRNGEKQWLLHPFFAIIPFDQDGGIEESNKNGDLDRTINRFLEHCSADGKQMRKLFFYCHPVFWESCLATTRHSISAEKLNELVMADFAPEIFVSCYFFRNHAQLLSSSPSK